jgi:hypothetical protein
MSYRVAVRSHPTSVHHQMPESLQVPRRRRLCNSDWDPCVNEPATTSLIIRVPGENVAAVHAPFPGTHESEPQARTTHDAPAVCLTR